MKTKRQKLMIAGMAMAITINSYADLQELIDAGDFNELEESAAVAALDTYDRLLAQGCLDGATESGQQASCTGSTFTLFSNVRELAHTANEITNDGPTTFSLGVDTEGLGFALRWTAAEEYAAQGNLSSEFIGGQISSLSSRLTALRLGASGFKVIGIGSNWNSSRSSRHPSVS